MSIAARRMISAATRDYVMERGERQADDTYSSTVLFLVTLRYNSSPVLMGLGSKFHLIDKLTDDATIRCEKEMERCLRPLTANRRITDLLTTARVENDVMLIDVSWRDSKGRSGSRKFTLPLG